MSDPANSSTPESKPLDSMSSDEPVVVANVSEATVKKAPGLWAGITLVGAVVIGLGIFLSSLFREESSVAPVPETPPAGVPTSTNRPASLEEHQKLVAEVVRSLDREVLMGGSPTLGNPDAPIVLLEFSDFQCPYCAQAVPQVKRALTDNSEDVVLVFKHLPLANIHPEALPAAFAAWAAGQQGKFWEFHDALFAQQAELGEALYVSIATDLGLDLDKFNRDRASEAAKAAIAKDLALASEFQLSGTPSFILDEIFIPGAVPAEFFTEAITRIKADSSNSQ